VASAIFVHKMYWAARTYPCKNADGSTDTCYGAQEVSIRVKSFLATTEDEKNGLGSANLSFAITGGFSKNPARDFK